MKINRYLCLHLIWVVIFASSAASANIKIALSFDDAPMPDSAILTGNERTEKIIAALKNNSVEDAIFYVKADSINASTTARLQQYTAAGFHLGNHSFSHQSADELSVNDFMADVYRAHLALKDFNNISPYFRPPYLHYGKDLAAVNLLQKYLAELGYQDGFVTVDHADWYINALLVKAAASGKSINYPKASELYVSVIWNAIQFFDDIAQKTIGRSPNHVLLLHENDTSALFLDSLIKHIKKKGGIIISPQEAYSDPIYKNFPQSAFQKQGRIGAIAAEKGMPKELLKNKEEKAEYLDALFLKYRVIK